MEADTFTKKLRAVTTLYLAFGSNHLDDRCGARFKKAEGYGAARPHVVTPGVLLRVRNAEPPQPIKHCNRTAHSDFIVYTSLEVPSHGHPQS